MTKTTKQIIGAMIGSIVAWAILFGLMVAIFPKESIIEMFAASGMTILACVALIGISYGLRQLIKWVDEPYQIADDSPCKDCKKPNEECCSNY